MGNVCMESSAPPPFKGTFRVGCIKLPYSELSAASEPRGWSFFSWKGAKKEGERGGGGLSMVTISLFFSLTILLLPYSFSLGVIQPAAEGKMG